MQSALPYTFENFVVGSCNALAREASLAVAHGKQRPLSLLYLASDSGLGKTHLARAIVGEARGQSDHRVIYASAESFTNDFMTSIRSRNMDQFKRARRGIVGGRTFSPSYSLDWRRSSKSSANSVPGCSGS